MIFLKSEPARLIYAPNPKAGSTSVYRLFLRLSGIDVEASARKVFRSPRMVRDFERAGLFNINQPGLDLAKFMKEHEDYFWFSFVRNPYDRVLSNYHNKLNRYAMRFAPGTYFRGKLGQMLSGPSAWRSHIAGLNFMKREIPFEAMVDGLVEHGVSFDRHFERQQVILRPGRVRYDLIGKVENFAEDMRSVLANAKMAGTEALLEAEFPRENASKYDRPKAEHFSEPIRRKLFGLYRRDFEMFGYASELPEAPDANAKGSAAAR